MKIVFKMWLTCLVSSEDQLQLSASENDIMDFEKLLDPI